VKPGKVEKFVHIAVGCVPTKRLPRVNGMRGAGQGGRPWTRPLQQTHPARRTSGLGVHRNAKGHTMLQSGPHHAAPPLLGQSIKPREKVGRGTLSAEDRDDLALTQGIRHRDRF
jgi:hypothetical protein